MTSVCCRVYTMHICCRVYTMQSCVCHDSSVSDEVVFVMNRWVAHIEFVINSYMCATHLFMTRWCSCITASYIHCNTQKRLFVWRVICVPLICLWRAPPRHKQMSLICVLQSIYDAVVCVPLICLWRVTCAHVFVMSHEKMRIFSWCASKIVGMGWLSRKDAHLFVSLFIFSWPITKRCASFRDSFRDGYCSTVQGLFDWFEVDVGFPELVPFRLIRVFCVFVLSTPSRSPLVLY